MSIDLLSDALSEQWDAACDWVEDYGGELGAIVSQKVLRKLYVEAPVMLGFCVLCVAIHAMSFVLPNLGHFLAVEDRFEPLDPLQYFRLFTHIAAHSSNDHLKGNLTHLLLVGPSAEHVFGSKELLVVLAAVAVASALAHILMGSSYTYQLGASGVVFAFILLNSLISAQRGKIPLSFVLTAGWWVSDELWALFFAHDGVSHHAHLTGAAVGTLAGYYLQRRKERQLALQGVVPHWRQLVAQRLQQSRSTAATARDKKGA